MVLTRSFAHRGGRIPDEVANRELDLPACDIEIATIVTDDGPAWSFALEAWGPADMRRSLLDGSLTALIAAQSWPPEGFVAALALNMGYPEWLATKLTPES